MKNNILWLVAGMIGVGAATSLSFVFESPWAGYFASMAVAVLVLILMAKNMMKDISSSGMKKTMVFLFAGLIVLQGYSSIIHWNKAQFQKETLREIRRTIDGSIGQIESEKLLIQALRSYYSSENDSTLEEHFRKVADDKLQEDGSITVRDMQDEADLKLYYEIPASDSIVIYISSQVALGDNPEFENRGGKTGRYEARATLTERGVSYARQN